MTGDILHEDLSIERGAFLEGHCKRIEEKPEAKGAGKPVNLVVKEGSSKEHGQSTGSGGAAGENKVAAS
jgi:cytoskeletal protein CcmA (bactofilin family)